jgi:hypothetical protein
VALKYFYHAARVASRYAYEWGDALQLTKVMTKISEYIFSEIWCDSCTGKVRSWQDPTNAATSARWTLAFFDALLMWEERINDRFLPILQANHKTGIAKVFSLLSPEVRVGAFQTIDNAEFPAIQSARLHGALGATLQRPKISISDLELTIVSEGGRRRKRKER